MVLPVMGSVSPIKTDFQDYTAVTGPATEGDWYFNTNTRVASPDTYGHIYSTISGGTGNTYIQSVTSTSFNYAAFTARWLGANQPQIQIELLDSTGAVLRSSGYYLGVSSAGTRIETVVSGGTAYFYANDVLFASGAVTLNPSYIKIISTVNGGYYSTGFDDIIIGYSDDATIIGSIPPDWFIHEDSSAPAARGLYQLNTTDPTGIPIPKDSNYFGLSYGRPYPDATVLTITNPAGTAVKSYPVANMSCQCVIPISDLSVAGAPIQNGKWSVSLGDSSTTSYFWVTTSGAYVAWSSDEYSQGDSATVTWDVTNDYWDVHSPGEHYIYTLSILDVYGTVLHSQTITTQTGTYDFDWSTSDSTGVYYAEIIVRNTLAPITESILNWDETELTGYAKFQGTVYDANTTAELDGALVSMAQLGTEHTYTTAANGTYLLTGFLTGSAININVTKSGYTRYNYSFVPLVAKNISLDFALLNQTDIAYTGVAISGIARSKTYGQLIPNASVYVWNASESYVKVANPRGYYICDNGHSCSLSYKLYNVQGNKTGYSVSDIYKVVTG
jgi:hypothetical protein